MSKNRNKFKKFYIFINLHTNKLLLFHFLKDTLLNHSLFFSHTCLPKYKFTGLIYEYLTNLGALQYSLLLCVSFYSNLRVKIKK